MAEGVKETSELLVMLGTLGESAIKAIKDDGGVFDRIRHFLDDGKDVSEGIRGLSMVFKEVKDLTSAEFEAIGRIAVEQAVRVFEAAKGEGYDL